MALIEVRNLSRVFIRGDERILALNDVTIEIGTGEFIAITGPSGSGKSTFLYILGLLDAPDKGIYRLDGHPTESLSDTARAELRNKKIGFVFQAFHLLPRATALRNVAMPLVYETRETRRTDTEIVRLATEALERVGLSDRLHHQPNELSGGQRQRVAIARALVNQPSIILADEPTGNLDSKSGAEILALFTELNKQGVTIIMVTHDMANAARAQRQIGFFDGRIAKDTHVAP
jgi:putative ABC transport system ATP-binding protein